MSITIGEEIFEDMKLISPEKFEIDSQYGNALTELCRMDILNDIERSDDEALEDDWDDLSEEQQEEVDLVTDDDVEERIAESYTETIYLGVIAKNSLLYHSLIKYFRDVKGWNYDEMKAKMFFTEDEDNLYLTTGCFYDIIDEDLLGGDGSGKTKKQFLDWLNA